MKKQDTQKAKMPFENFPDKFVVLKDINENEIFNEKTFIGTELGGEGHRLRNYIIISSVKNQNFNKEQKQIISKIFAETCKKFDSKIEEVTFGKNYACIKMLVSIEVAVGKIIEKAIKLCNAYGNFLRFHYFVTNVKKPTRKDIQEYLKNIK